MFLSHELNQLIQMVSKLPGLGPRSARRIVLHLLKNRDRLIPALTDHLHTVAKVHKECSVCGYVDRKDPCFFCTSPHRDPGIICVVAETGDVWALEKASFFKGRYHVLGGLISAFRRVRPEDLSVYSLRDRLESEVVKEVVLAIDSTVDGQTTLHYLSQQIEQWAPRIRISSLARGMPVGGELDYLDQGTLMSAFLGRQNVPSFMADARQWIQEEGINE